MSWIRRRRVEQQGQVIPALLLAMVALLFFGLVFTQLGSAGDQKTQVQTAADSAAVADAHEMIDVSLSTTARTMPFPFAVIFQGTPAITAALHATACNAASTNWTANPHRTAVLDCGGVQVSPGAGAVTVDVTGPPDEVGHGPVEVQAARAAASATAQVTIARCPVVAGAPAAKAVTDWILDQIAITMAAPGTRCVTPAETQALQALALLPLAQQRAAIGPPTAVLNAADDSLQAELVN